MNRFVVVAACLFMGLSACGDDVDTSCLTKNAVRDDTGACACPKGTHIEVSVCVRNDAGVDVASSTAADGGQVQRPTLADAGNVDAAGKPEKDATPSDEAPLEPDAALEPGEQGATPEDASLQPTPEPDAGMPMSMMPPACVPTVPPMETCNGKDDDCNGVIDQGVKTRCWADADGDGYAATAAALVESCDACGAKQTAQEPVAGKADCDDADTKKSPGATDICGDRVDNDCDGKPDDENNNACGGACSVQLPGRPGDACNNGQQGACARPGTYECRPDHSMVCNAPMVRAAAAEVCGNGKDDDCNNGVDDGCVKNLCGGWNPLTPPVGGSCMVTKGTCSYPGKYACAPGSTDATACGGEPPPESCSTAADDNCNGTANEGCCVSTTEVCDGKDNDCDGAVDEDTKNGCGGRCDSPGDLNQPGAPCSQAVGGLNKGECAKGVYECSNLADPVPLCTFNQPQNELCDFKDNDCNGLADEVEACNFCDPGLMALGGC